VSLEHICMARSAEAHPGSSRPCAHGCALDSPAAWLRSSLRSTRGAAQCRLAAPRRSCSCRRAQVTLHGTGWPWTHASVRTQPLHGRRIGGGQERNRAPSDAEDGVPVSAVTDESGATSLASLAPTAPRKAWHLANSASQLVTPGASWGVIWARHTTPNVASTTPCATLSMLTYYRTSRSSHFPFWAVCSLSGSQPEIWSVSWKPPVHRIACRSFVVPLNPTFRRSSQAEGERAPGSSGPVHSGQYGPTQPGSQYGSCSEQETSA
jgi:hypothetical protein